MNASSRFDLTLERTIRAPQRKVFDAFVKPEVVTQWFGPRGFTITNAEMDVKVGGRYRITMRARTGESYIVEGEYREVNPFERLAFTWQWEAADMAAMGETLVTVTLAEKAGTTYLKLHHSGFPAAQARDAHNGGWSSSLNCLMDKIDERGSAATLTLYGDPRSTYTRSARMGLAEKGLAYTLQQESPGSETIAALNPFKKIPVFRDGDLTLYETSAILRYVDESFEGPSLLAGNARSRATMEQWVSAINCYMYPVFIRDYVIPYVFPKGADGKPDRSVIDSALPAMRKHLAALDVAYGSNDYLAGTACSMADLLLAPILAYVQSLPEGKELLSAVPNVRRAHSVMSERPSFKATQPASR
jgi:glutathione S-transferase